MISQLGASTLKDLHTNNSSELKATEKSSVSVSKQGDMSKIDKIKESIESGEYKVDLQTLSEKIAEELL